MHSLCATNQSLMNKWWNTQFPTLSIDILIFLTSGSSQSHSLFTWFLSCKFGLVVKIAGCSGGRAARYFAMYIYIYVVFCRSLFLLCLCDCNISSRNKNMCLCFFIYLSCFFCVCFSLFLLISLFYLDFCSIYYIANSKQNHRKYKKR